MLIQPGRSDSFNDYRFPSKLPEALAQEVPVILPRCNLGLVLEDGVEALVTQDDSMERLIEKIVYLYENPAERIRIGEAGMAVLRAAPELGQGGPHDRGVLRACLFGPAEPARTRPVPTRDGRRRHQRVARPPPIRAPGIWDGRSPRRTCTCCSWKSAGSGARAPCWRTRKSLRNVALSPLLARARSKARKYKRVYIVELVIIAILLIGPVAAMTELVSIVVASYNYERFIATTLQSILAQSLPAWEALVVDDGSTDDSLAVIGRFCRLDARFRLLQHEGGRNHGLAASLQLGIRHAAGNWIAFCESDDWWDPRLLEQLTTCAQANPRSGLVFSDVVLEGESASMEAHCALVRDHFRNERARHRPVPAHAECGAHHVLRDGPCGTHQRLRFQRALCAVAGHVAVGAAGRQNRLLVRRPAAVPLAPA